MATQPPLSTSQQSPDSLPLVGYSLDQLCRYIVRQLGGSIFTIELTQQDIIDNVLDSMGQYSQWRPRIRYGTIALQTGKFDYLAGVDLGLGPVQVNFVQRSPIPQALFWGNLIDATPLLMTGMADYDSFLRWQKMWERVSSIKPDWVYDEINKVLMIHNPIERFHCGVVAYAAYENVTQLDRFGADWVKRHSLEKCRKLYSEALNKFSGAIPGPIKDLQLDSRKKDDAKEEIQKLEDKLFAAQISMPLGVD